MSLAADTREAARAHPFLYTALRAGVCNYTAAADFLDLDGDTDAVATALRRFAEDLPSFTPEACDARVSMESGVGLLDVGDAPSGAEDEPVDVEDAPNDAPPLLAVAGTGVYPDAGSLTAILAAGNADARALGCVLGRLAVEEVSVEAAGVADGCLVVVVPRRTGARAVQMVEDALETVPSV